MAVPLPSSVSWLYTILAGIGVILYVFILIVTKYRAPSVLTGEVTLEPKFEYPEYPKIKVLVAITGEYRGPAGTTLILKHIVEPLNADIAIYCDKPGIDFFREECLERIKFQINDPIPDNIDNQRKMFYRIWKLNQLTRTGTYDLVIRVRPDLHFTRPIPLSDIEDALNGNIMIRPRLLLAYVVGVHNYSDTFWICKPEYDDVLSSLWSYYPRTCMNPETLLTNFIKLLPVKPTQFEHNLQGYTYENLDRNAVSKFLSKRHPDRGCNITYNPILRTIVAG